MHELSLAQALVSQLEEVAQREGAKRIIRIEMELGAMSGVERDAFEFAFPVVSEGTLAEGAELIFDEVPVKVSCAGCGKDSAPTPPVMICEHCGGTMVSVIEGRDFKVKSMEVSDDV